MSYCCDSGVQVFGRPSRQKALRAAVANEVHSQLPAASSSTIRRSASQGPHQVKECYTEDATPWRGGRTKRGAPAVALELLEGRAAHTISCSMGANLLQQEWQEGVQPTDRKVEELHGRPVLPHREATDIAIDMIFRHGPGLLSCWATMASISRGCRSMRRSSCGVSLGKAEDKSNETGELTQDSAREHHCETPNRAPSSLKAVVRGGTRRNLAVSLCRKNRKVGPELRPPLWECSTRCGQRRTCLASQPT